MYLLLVFSAAKEGFAFLPIDVSYGSETTNFRIADANACLTCIDRFFPSLNGKIVVVDRLDPTHLASCYFRDAFSLGYTIYTSGSTGNPKGVLLTQKNSPTY